VRTGAEVRPLVDSVQRCSCEVAESGRGMLEKPEEDERPPLEGATKQRLVKTEKTSCVL
jgi:hypothetical protein